MTAVIVIIFPDHTVAVFCDYTRKNLRSPGGKLISLVGEQILALSPIFTTPLKLSGFFIKNVSLRSEKLNDTLDT